MRYNVVREMDISNGPGVRVSIFFQGCPFHCKGCFNENTWDFDGGKEYTEEIKKQVLDCANKDYTRGLSILGGEPLCPTNIGATIELAKAFKEKYGLGHQLLTAYRLEFGDMDEDYPDLSGKKVEARLPGVFEKIQKELQRGK